MASQDIVAFKQPQESHLASDLKSVTMITYLPIHLWPLSTAIG